MKKIFSLCLLLSTTIAAADIVRSPIHSVEKLDDSYVIKFSNGRAAYTSDDVATLSEGDVVEAKLDDKQNLISLQTISKGERAGIQKAFNPVYEYNPPPYEPTVMTVAEATAMFNRLNPNYKRETECSNRAHVWSHEEFTKNGIKSLKVFVFFTSTYMRSVGLKWWFHVAPAVMVKEGNKTEVKVLDYMFNRRPITVKEWTDQFVFTKRACKPTHRFSEHWTADQKLDCYVTVDTMYNWMPLDLKNQEDKKQYKTQFYTSQVNAAYSEAF